jgi:hypothetical protein
VRYDIKTQYRSCTLKIPISATVPTEVYALVRSSEVPGAILIRRVEIYQPGDETPMYLKLPLTGKNITIQIFDNLEDPDGTPSTFTIGDIKVMGLDKRMYVVRDNDPYIDEWILFRGQFAFNANWLPLNEPDQVYKSENGRFKIRYVDVILDDNGKEDVTPMQINKYNGVITVSRNKINEAQLTVPGLVGVLDHEYSHLYRNVDKANEEESDLNGLTISLGSGYPPYDVVEGYYSILYNVDSQENFDRLMVIDDFVSKFYKLSA